MDINKNVDIIKELEIALTYYIKGLVVKLNSEYYIGEIQRIVEQSLLSYNVIDFRKENFLSPSVSIINKNILIDLNNEHSNHSQIKKHIKIKIPFIEKRSFNNPEISDSYILGGKVKIKIIE